MLCKGKFGGAGFVDKGKSVHFFSSDPQAFGDSAQSFGPYYDRSIHNTPSVFVIVADTDLWVWSFICSRVRSWPHPSLESHDLLSFELQVHPVAHAVLALCVWFMQRPTRDKCHLSQFFSLAFARTLRLVNKHVFLVWCWPKGKKGEVWR